MLPSRNLGSGIPWGLIYVWHSLAHTGQPVLPLWAEGVGVAELGAHMLWPGHSGVDGAGVEGEQPVSGLGITIFTLPTRQTMPCSAGFWWSLVRNPAETTGTELFLKSRYCVDLQK
jgi:hypothetical protein